MNIGRRILLTLCFLYRFHHASCTRIGRTLLLTPPDETPDRSLMHHPLRSSHTAAEVFLIISLRLSIKIEFYIMRHE